MTEKALKFAEKAHEGQTRKGTDLPYVSHPIAVASWLFLADSSPEVVIVGLLHDTIEDTDATYEDIEKEFGKKTADLVVGVSEADKNDTWFNRKSALVDTIETVAIETVLVKTADNLHNLSSVRDELLERGEAVWDKFNAPKTDQKWYFTSLLEGLKNRVANENDSSLRFLVGEFEKIVNEVFND